MIFILHLVDLVKVDNCNYLHFPSSGLYVDSVIEVAKKELNWECDYIREAECTTRFRNLVKPYPEYYVPEVISQLCTKQVGPFFLFIIHSWNTITGLQKHVWWSNFWPLWFIYIWDYVLPFTQYKLLFFIFLRIMETFLSVINCSRSTFTKTKNLLHWLDSFFNTKVWFTTQCFPIFFCYSFINSCSVCIQN